MSDNLKALNLDELENATGGELVNTGSSQNAVVRSGPGKGFPQIGSLKNGTRVVTTGESVDNFDDGRTWYEISSPLYGWIAGSLIGY